MTKEEARAELEAKLDEVRRWKASGVLSAFEMSLAHEAESKLLAQIEKLGASEAKP